LKLICIDNYALHYKLIYHKDLKDMLLFATLFVSARQVSAQQTVPTVGDNSNNLARLSDLTLISVTPYYFCHLASSYEILGYAEGSYTPVYKNYCEGLCFAQAAFPLECRQQITYIKVNVSPNTYTPYSSKIVAQVTGCQCRPKRCVVTKYGYTSFIENGEYTYDECDRRCRCSYGQIVECCRQRKSFTDMSFLERTRYINTFKTISTLAPYKAQYDAMVAMHQTLFSSGIHGTAAFFPWHRYHILKAENLLQQVDCRVTVPYWDWNSQAASPFSGSPWLNATDWFGGDGNGVGGCVTTGPFQTGQWALPGGACLTRSFIPSALFATMVDVQQLYNNYPNPVASDYNNIRYNLEAGPGMHNVVHCSIGANMCTTNAAASPEFLLHHCNIDRLWAGWQSLSPAHVLTYAGNPSVSMPGTTATPNDMLDLNNQLGGIRVCYIKSARWTWYTDLLATMTQAQLISLSRTPVTVSKPEWPNLRFFNFTKIRLDEAARNNLPNMLSRTDVLISNTIVASTGIGLDLTNVVGQYDATGCLNKQYTADINDRCDTNCPLVYGNDSQMLDNNSTNTTGNGGT
jgi:tyrosinase